MYDHHCPWVGNCIGEKNKGIFLVFLFLQLVEFFTTLIKVTLYFIFQVALEGSFREISMGGLVLFISAIVFSISLTIIVSLLFSYHIYIATRNLTTCTFIIYI